uniref:mRNA_cap_enzyme domain-containing protein n=1 Tax=Steinernema glaseri TaxID=37863 RepID=A0A1I7ZWR6_9BILA
MEDSKEFNASAPWNDDLQLLLSIPVPPTVTRTQPDGKKNPNPKFHKSYILWTKEDGSALGCTVTTDNKYKKRK